MNVDCRISEDNREAAIHFPDPSPGYTIFINAKSCEQLIQILRDVRQNLEPPPALPGETPLEKDED